MTMSALVVWHVAMLLCGMALGGAKFLPRRWRRR
jgi:hypothetical protein